jgi:leucyl-tRNA synthetase
MTELVDFRDFEVKWQKKWKESQTFESTRDSKREKRFFTVPYPYMSGPLHIGHGRTYTVADIYARYLRMKGFNILWPMAWHITGTPVLGVSSRIKEKDPVTMDLYRYYIGLYEKDSKKITKILSSFTDPWKIAKFFANVCRGDFSRLGYSIDWTRQFTTGDPEYNQFITWQFLTLKEKGYIKKGTYPVLFCTNCKNAVGEDDILQGETAKIIEFSGLKFPFEDGFLVACTLRPETLFGVTNLWINPEEVYCKIKINGEIWFVAEKSLVKLRTQNHEIEILEKFQGRELCGKSAKSPIENRDLPILPAEFVDPSNATGVVYSVPAHAPFDWIALLDLQKNPEVLKPYGISEATIKELKPISLISIEGYGEFPAVEICIVGL